MSARWSPTKGCRSPRLRGSLLLAASLVGACADASDCAGTTPQPSGNLDALGGAVLVTPPGQTEPAHSYVVVANPDLQALRVQDTFDTSFLRAPNLYFPLTVPTGAATRRLALPGRESAYLVALDAAEDQLRFVRTVADERGAAWSTRGLVDTAANPAGLALREEGTSVFAFLALPDEGEVQVLEIDLPTLELQNERRIALPDHARPGDVSLTPDLRFLLIADAALAALHVVDLSSPEPERARTLVLPAPTHRVVSGRVEVEGAPAVVTVALLQGRAGVSVLHVAATLPESAAGDEVPAELWGTVALPATATAAYVPDVLDEGETPLPSCCTGLPSGAGASAAVASVASALGDIWYVRLGRRPGLFDTDAQAPQLAEGVAVDASYAPAEDEVEGRRPELRLEPLDGYGPAPSLDWQPYAADDVTYTLTYGGLLPDFSDVPVLATGNTLRLSEEGPAPSERGLHPGDVVYLRGEGERSSCLAAIAAVVEELTDEPAIVLSLSAAEEACLASAGDLRADARATGDWVCVRSDRGYLGRSFQPAAGEGAAVWEDEWVRVTLSARPEGFPAAGSRFTLPVSLRFAPAGVRLGATSNISVGEFGFGSGARLPGALVGGEVERKTLDEEGNESGTRERSLWMTTSAGLLLEMTQLETAPENAQSYD